MFIIYTTKAITILKRKTKVVVDALDNRWRHRRRFHTARSHSSLSQQTRNSKTTLLILISDTYDDLFFLLACLFVCFLLRANASAEGSNCDESFDANNFCEDVECVSRVFSKACAIQHVRYCVGMQTVPGVFSVKVPTEQYSTEMNQRKSRRVNKWMERWQPTKSGGWWIWAQETDASGNPSDAPDKTSGRYCLSSLMITRQIVSRKPRSLKNNLEDVHGGLGWVACLPKTAAQLDGVFSTIWYRVACVSIIIIIEGKLSTSLRLSSG